MKNSRFNKIISLFILLTLSSCAIQSRNDQKSIRSLYQRGHLSQALSKLENSDLKKEKVNRLLYLMEKGKLLYADKQYFKASNVFLQANELVDKLYTKSIRESIASGIINDNSKTYFGSVFERSMLYYYQALSYFKLHQIGKYKQVKEVTVKDKDGNESLESKEVWITLDKKKRRTYLFSARASLVAWDTFFKDVQRSSRIKTLYQSDLMSKILGGNIHEQFARRSESQIALDLYKDARKVLIQLGPSYKNFNEEFKKYSLELKSKLDVSGYKIKKETIITTSNYKNLKDYLDYKILFLTRKYKRNTFKTWFKRLSPSKAVLKRLKNKEPNVSILIEDNIVAELKAKMFTYNLRTALENIESPGTRALVKGIGIPILTYFAMGPLGLGGISRSGNTTIYTSHNVGTNMVSEVGIEFELPMVEESAYVRPYKLIISKGTAEKAEVVYSGPLVMTGPISDIALQAANERVSNSFAKRGTRIAIKHVVAILAAYNTYKSVQGSAGEFLAKPAAIAVYLSGSKGIAATEKADARYWSTLPGNIFLKELYIAPGSYDVKVHIPSEKLKVSIVSLGKLEVKDQKKNLFTYQVK